MYSCRWPIAIKTTRVHNKGNLTHQSSNRYSQSNKSRINDEEISLLLDEAKTMCKVGSYHDNIVNLQGICVNVEDGSIRRVSCVT